MEISKTIYWCVLNWSKFVKRIDLLIGFPGAGKSTYVKEYIKIKPNALVVNADAFRKVITGQDFWGNAEEYVWAAVKTSVRVFIKDHDILLDETGLSVKVRSQWINIAKDAGVPINAIWINTPFEICCQRNLSRERIVPLPVMDHFRDIFVEPSLEEGFDSITQVVDGKVGATIINQELRLVNGYSEKHAESIASKNTITVIKSPGGDGYTGWADGTFVLGEGKTEEECIRDTREKLKEVVLQTITNEIKKV